MRAGDFASLSPAHQGGAASVSIGSNVDIGRFAYVDYSGGVVIGNGVAISDGVKIYTHNHTVRDALIDWSKNPIAFTPLVIEDYAWIGSNAVILAGVSRIGRGAIVGAGSVVTREVPPDTIVAGSPAKIVGVRGSRDASGT